MSERELLVQAVRALEAAKGYMINAKIDLDTGAPKKTAAMTLEGGISFVTRQLASLNGEDADE